MAAIDPVIGPLSPQEWRDAISAPCGEAAKIIRKHDPLWGRESGEKFQWMVRCRSVNMHGYAIVEATSQNEANHIAHQLGEGDINWNHDAASFEVVSVTPHDA